MKMWNKLSKSVKRHSPNEISGAVKNSFLEINII